MRNGWQVTCFLALGVLAHLSGSSLNPQSTASPSAYHPGSEVSGLIRVWGSNEMAGVLKKWEDGFCRYQTQVHFEDHLYGTASSIAGLYTGVADISLLGRDIWPIESMAFRSVFSYEPTGISVATGSYDIPKAAYALVIYVHKLNPLSQLTMNQLAGIFGVPKGPDGRRIRMWGDLGLTGKWSSVPIHTYQFDYDNDKSIFFRRVVFAGRYRWRDSTEEFANHVNSDGTVTDSGKLILDTLADDPLGIAVSNPHYANNQVKAIALSADGKRFVSASKASVQENSYPLTRGAWIYINRPLNQAPERRISEFLRYVLSLQGQKDVAADGTYLPLSENAIEKELTSMRKWVR